MRGRNSINTRKFGRKVTIFKNKNTQQKTQSLTLKQSLNMRQTGKQQKQQS